MSVLSQIRQELQGRLQALPYFADVPVLTEDAHDLESDLARAMGALDAAEPRVGACVILLTPRGAVEFPDVGGPVFENPEWIARVLEHPAINRGERGTGKTGADIQEQVMAGLHHFRPLSANGPVAVKAFELAPDPIYQAYDITFTVPASLRITLPQAAAPVLAQGEDGLVTMTCATPGAAIFYTDDGTAPMPRNGTLYLEPLSLSQAATLKARAFLAGYLHSTISALAAEKTAT